MKNKKSSMKFVLFFVLAVMIAAVLAAVSFNTDDLSPADQNYTTDPTPNFAFNATSNVSATMNCSLVIDGALFGNSTANNDSLTTITANASLTQDAHSWYINCTDEDGSQQTTPRIIIYDATAPAVTMHTEDTNTSNPLPSFNFSFIDDLSSSASCFLWINAVGYGFNASTINDTATIIQANGSVSDGVYTNVNVTCTDLAGNADGSAPITLKVDVLPPTVSLLNTSFATANTNPTIYFNFTDALSPTADCSLYFDSTGYNYTAGINRNTTTALTANTTPGEGNHSVYVNCTDDVGNIDKSNVIYVVIDTTGPAVTISSPTDGQHVYDNTTDIYFTVSDDFSSTFDCTVYVNGSVYGANDSVIADTLTMVTNSTSRVVGTYSLVVNCTDELDNLGTSGAQTFVIDRTAPTISSISTSGTSSATTTGTATISAATDEDSTCWYKGSAFNATNTTGATMMSGNGTSSSSFTVGYSEDGTIGPYYISCRDVAGNNMTSSNTTGSISVSVTESSSHGGGGGGGSVPSNPSTSQTWTHVSAGSASIMKITNDDFGLKQIIITVNNPVKNMVISIEKLAGKPAVVTKNITGKVFRYLKINKNNINDSDLNGTLKIKFQVTQSWLLANNIEAKNIVLKRFVIDNWNDLKTTLVSTDNKYAYYEAETPGFSYFAIAEKSAETTTPPAEQPVEQPAETPTTQEPPAEQPPATTPPQQEKAPVVSEKKTGDAGKAIGAILIIIAAALLIFLATRKKGSRKHGSKKVTELE